MTVSQAWFSLKAWRVRHSNDDILPFYWFVLALDTLFTIGAVNFENGLLHRKRAI